MLEFVACELIKKELPALVGYADDIREWAEAVAEGQTAELNEFLGSQRAKEIYKNDQFLLNPPENQVEATFRTTVAHAVIVLANHLVSYRKREQLNPLNPFVQFSDQTLAEKIIWFHNEILNAYIQYVEYSK